MFRRLVYLLSMAALVSALLPTNPASAAQLDAAVITGTVAQNQGTCTLNSSDAKPYDDLPHNAGELVAFQDVAMAATFGNFSGIITAQPVDACAHSYDLQDVVEPLDALAGWGRITAGAAFEEDIGLLGKCIDGKVGKASAIAGSSAGDYIQVGVVAIVKFDISYTTGTLVDDACIAKKTVTELNCVGIIAVAPIESITTIGTVGDPVAGAIVCNELLPSNK